VSISNQAQWMPVTIAKVNEPYKALFASLDLTNPVTVDLSLIQSQQFIKTVRGIYVDNQNSIGGKITIKANRTNHTLIIPKQSQAFLPIFAPDPVLLTISDTVADIVGFQLLNFPVGPFVWSVA
jgi:hypothetical protein